MNIVSRAAWGAVPAKSRTAVAPSALRGVTVHWFGSPKAASSHAGCDGLLRSVQRFHMAPGGLGVANGGSDIAYNHAVCPHGTVYELRGFGAQTGANGTGTGNRTHAAIVYMAGTGDPFTDAGKAGLQFLIGEWQKRGAGAEVFPHQRWTGSSCPGPDILAWLAAGPPKEVEIVEAWVPPFLAWYIGPRTPATRPAEAPARIPGRVWELVKVVEADRKARPGSDPEAAVLRAKIAAALRELA